MARGIERLPASYMKLKPGMHCDGGNLYLQVSLGKDGNRRLSWIFRYKLPGQKTRDMGLGSANDIALSEAREIARRNRRLLTEGRDPIGERDAEFARNLSATTVTMSFDQAAEEYIKQHSPGWSNAKHGDQWRNTLKAYASPVLGKMSVADIDTPHVMKVLNPIWTTKTETANRVRGRIEAILGWATVSGFRSGENPARWRDHLSNLLAPKGKVQPVRHQTALPYSEMPAFFGDLRERPGMAALALEFLILTCVRTVDVRNAKTADIDRDAGVWVIPALSKTGKEHRVPLSTAALAAYDKARVIADEIGGKVAASEFAFPNDRSGAPLSENSMLALLNRMGRKGAATSHGFRASFRTWAQEATSFPWELSELSLGHTVGDKVERAYARGNALKKRFSIMQAWGDFCTKPFQPSNVAQLRDRRA